MQARQLVTMPTNQPYSPPVPRLSSAQQNSVIVDQAWYADILREEIDGAADLRAGSSNLPEQQDWPLYVVRLAAPAGRH